MRRASSAIALLLAGAALAQDPPAPAPADPVDPIPAKPADPIPAKPEDPGVPAPAAPPALSLERFDFARPFDLVACESALGRLTQAHPDLVHVKSLGKSRAGHDVWVVSVSDARGGDVEHKPALVVCSDAAAGPEPVLYTIARILADAEEKPEVAALLRDRALYLLPACDPDLVAEPARAEAAASRAAAIERNFPVDWSPWDSLGKDDEGAPVACGPYPLSEPEAQLLARFLQARAAISVLVELAPRSANGSAATLPPISLPGSLAAFCGRMLGAQTLRAAPWTGAPAETRFGPAPTGFDLVASDVEARLSSLPHLDYGTTAVERLRADLWLVDVGVRNAGSLPTVGVEDAGGGTSVWVRASGGRVVAAATRRTDSPSFAAAPLVVREGADAWGLGHLREGEEIVLRLVVQSAEKTALEIALGSVRAGERRLSVPLVQPP